MNTIFKTVRPKKSAISFLGIIFIISIIISACEEDPSSLGSDLLPDNSNIRYRYDSTMQFKATVESNNFINTTNLSHYSLGINQDDYFGTFTGQYAGQYYPSSSIDDVEDIIIDSAVLYLDIDSIYGFSNPDDIYFNIYELNSDIVIDSAYYSYTPLDDYYTEENPINTNSIVAGDSLLVFSLTNSFADKFISFGNEVYDSAALFRDIFKGICIVPQLINPPGGLITINAASDESKLVLYYRTLEEDSLKTNFSLSHRFAEYINDYSTGLANNYIINSTDENDNLLFVQGLNGIKSKFKFLNIVDWQNSDSSYSILNAELTIPIADYDFNGFSPPDNLYFYYTNEDSSLIKIEDYGLGDIFGGRYYDTCNVYKFNISKHFMNVVNNNIEDSCLNFTFNNKSFFPNRVILNSEEIKLKVTYTKH